MNQFYRLVFGLTAILMVVCSVTGCYKRTVAPTYSSDEAEVKRIREQLGVKTADKEFTNLEEEEE